MVITKYSCITVTALLFWAYICILFELKMQTLKKMKNYINVKEIALYMN